LPLNPLIRTRAIVDDKRNPTQLMQLFSEDVVNGIKGSALANLEYQPDRPYNINEIASRLGVIYQSTIPDNLGHTPLPSSSANWRVIGYSGIAVSSNDNRVSYSGLSTGTVVSISPGDEFSMYMDAAEFSCTLLINDVGNGTIGSSKPGFFLVSQNNIVEVSDTYNIFTPTNAPAAGQVGVYIDGSRYIYILNNRAVAFNFVITVNGARVDFAYG